MGTSFSQGTVPIDNQGRSGACYAYAAARVVNVSLRQFGLSNDNSIYYSILKLILLRPVLFNFGDPFGNVRVFDKTHPVASTSAKLLRVTVETKLIQAQGCFILNPSKGVWGTGKRNSFYFT